MFHSRPRKTHVVYLVSVRHFTIEYLADEQVRHSTVQCFEHHSDRALYHMCQLDMPRLGNLRNHPGCIRSCRTDKCSYCSDGIRLLLQDPRSTGFVVLVRSMALVHIAHRCNMDPTMSIPCHKMMVTCWSAAA